MGVIDDYNRIVQERLRVYQEPMDPLEVEKLKLELQKTRAELAKTKGQQNTEFINKYGTILAAKEHNKNSLLEAIIKSQTQLGVANIQKAAQTQAQFTQSVMPILEQGLGTTDAAAKAAKKVTDTIFQKSEASIRQSAGDTVAEQLENKATLSQALDASIQGFDKTFVNAAEEFRTLTPSEKYIAKGQSAYDISNEITKSIMQSNPSLNQGQVQQYILNTIKNKPEFAISQAEADNYRENYAAQRAVVERAATQQFGAAAPNIMASIKKFEKDEDPYMTIKQFAADFAEVPDDPTIKKAIEDIEKQIKNLDAPRETAFGAFYNEYIQSPQKDTLNEIIGIRDDKNAAYIYLNNPDMLQSAVVGIQNFYSPDDPSLADSIDPGEPLPPEELSKLRNELAADLGVRSLSKNISPLRLRLAMARKAPLRFDPTVQRNIQMAEAVEPTAEQVEEIQEVTQTTEEEAFSGMRVVKGRGGYQYGQSRDGKIFIIDGPTGKGATLTKGKAYDAITKEIGKADSVPSALFNKPLPAKDFGKKKITPKAPEPTMTVEEFKKRIVKPPSPQVEQPQEQQPQPSEPTMTVEELKARVVKPPAPQGVSTETPTNVNPFKKLPSADEVQNQNRRAIPVRESFGG